MNEKVTRVPWELLILKMPGAPTEPAALGFLGDKLRAPYQVTRVPPEWEEHRVTALQVSSLCHWKVGPAFTGMGRAVGGGLGQVKSEVLGGEGESGVLGEAALESIYDQTRGGLGTGTVKGLRCLPWSTGDTAEWPADKSVRQGWRFRRHKKVTGTGCGRTAVSRKPRTQIGERKNVPHPVCMLGVGAGVPHLLGGCPCCHIQVTAAPEGSC